MYWLAEFTPLHEKSMYPPGFVYNDTVPPELFEKEYKVDPDNSLVMVG